VPNGPSRQSVMRKAAAAQLDPTQVSFLECHSTATSLVPIEINSVMEVYCNGRAQDRQLVLGAVKSNIGHLGKISAGLCKITLVLQKKQIPANLHFTKLNPKLRFGVHRTLYHGLADQLRDALLRDQLGQHQTRPPPPLRAVGAELGRSCGGAASSHASWTKPTKSCCSTPAAARSSRACALQASRSHPDPGKGENSSLLTTNRGAPVRGQGSIYGYRPGQPVR
jgi:hypothetical protein